MTADPSTTRGPEPGKAQPGSASSNRPLAPDKVDGRDDEIFKRSMADLSRRLSERAARQSAADPGAAAEARRAALQAYDRARERRLIVAMGVAMAAVIGVGIAYLASTAGSQPGPPSPSAAARTAPASPLSIATAAPAPAPPESALPSPASSSPPAASVPYAPDVESVSAEAALAADSQLAPVPPESVAPLPLSSPTIVASASGAAAATPEAAPATARQPAPVEPALTPAPLRRDEVREVQARLRSFGLDPGPVDGVPGPMTEDAVMHYQRHRDQLQTGKADRQLLEQLRQDPAARVAQSAVRPGASRATGSPAARRSDPFEPVRAAGNRLGQWLESLTR